LQRGREEVATVCRIIATSLQAIGASRGEVAMRL
jgi:hypothetical protein